MKESSGSRRSVFYLCKVILNSESFFRQMILAFIIFLAGREIAEGQSLDSSAFREKPILKKVMNLQSEVRKLIVQRDSLKEEIVRIYPNNKLASNLRNLEKSWDQQAESTEYNLWEWMQLLSEARRLSFVPESKREELEKRILKKMNQLERQKNSDKSKKIDGPDRRMDLNKFPFMELDICSVEYFEEGKIASTGFIDLAGQTDSLIEGQMLDRDFAVCSTRVFYSGSKWYADWKIEFASGKASSIYGLLDAAIPLKLEFIDGSYTYLFPSASTQGESDPLKNICVYQIQTPLDQSKLKILKEKELFSITVLWEKGKEKFDIYHISAIKNLISCLDKKN